MDANTEKQAAADNQARREAREKDRKAAEEQVRKDAEERNKLNLAKMEADAKLRPTPTPEEIQMAVAGHVVDQKEPDGAPLQNERHPITNAAQQIEVGRETPTAQPVEGTDKDGKTTTDNSNRSGASPSSSSSKPANTGTVK